MKGLAGHCPARPARQRPERPQTCHNSSKDGPYRQAPPMRRDSVLLGFGDGRGNGLHRAGARTGRNGGGTAVAPRGGTSDTGSVHRCRHTRRNHGRGTSVRPPADTCRYRVPRRHRCLRPRRRHDRTAASDRGRIVQRKAPGEGAARSGLPMAPWSVRDSRFAVHRRRDAREMRRSSSIPLVLRGPDPVAS